VEGYHLIGRRVPKIDGIAKATGRAKYTEDLVLPGMLYGKILRTHLHHARIKHIDTSRAKRLIGVKGIITSQDIPEPERWIERSHRADGRFLAVDKVRFMGDEVAAVAAIDEDTALEAVNLIQVEYEELPGVFDPQEALKPDAPKIHDRRKDNLADTFRVDNGDIDKGFQESDYIFEDEYKTACVYQCYLEPICSLASFEMGKLKLWTGSMYPSGVRISLAEVLKIPESKIQVIQPYVGGAFGGRIDMQPLHPISALLSMKTGKPVVIANSREEEFLATLPSIPLFITIKIGVKGDGTFLAKQVDIVGNNGAYVNWGRMIIRRTILAGDTLYRFPNTRGQEKLVFTNTPPIAPYRGFGTRQAMFAVESLLDQIAEGLNIDPMDLRMKNAIKEGEVGVHGEVVKSCGLPECIRRVRESIQWNDKKRHKLPGVGVGMACTMYWSEGRLDDGFGGAVVFLKILEDGRIQIVTGEAEYGQGMWNVFAQIAGEELGVPLENIEVTHPDTDVTPFSLGPWGGGRATVTAGNAVRLAALDAKEQIFETTAELLEANYEELVIKGGQIQVKGSPTRRISLAQVAKSRLHRRGGSMIIGKGVDERNTDLLDPRTHYGNFSSAYTFAAQAAEVKVDRETGEVKLLNFCAANDQGKAINPMLAEGQLEGSAVQGIGSGLMEQLLRREGNILNPNLLDYKIPTASDLPQIQSILVESFEPNGPYGTKAAGLQGIIPPAPAIANAIYDAVGIRIKEIPMTPQKVLEALEKKKGG